MRTRDALRQLAERDGLTMDAQIRHLIRSERQRRIGAELAERGLSEEDHIVLDASARDAADARG